jgi:hypothetical protein
MLIDVAHPDKWDELNDELRSFLNLSAKVRARAFYGISQAVFEISQSTAHFMSHKKAMGVVKGQTPLFESLLPYYYKETYKVQVASFQDLLNPTEWVQQLEKDTCFVLLSEDHPVTGETYPFVEELDKLLNEKRIFVFRVSHHRHFYEGIELKPYTVRLCSYGAQAAVALLGERFRSPSLSTQGLNWDKEAFIKSLIEARDGRAQNRLEVEKFEKQITAPARAWFSANNENRIYDRAVAVFNDVNGEALAQKVFEKLGIPVQEGWRQMDTPNQCHWNAVRMFKTWWQPEPTTEDLRGMMIISLSLLETKDFAKTLISSYEEIKALQSWEV